MYSSVLLVYVAAVIRIYELHRRVQCETEPRFVIIMCVCVCPTQESKDMKSKYSVLPNLCPEQAECFGTRVDITRILNL